MYSVYVWVRGKFMGVDSLLPPRGSWELNSGRQAWQGVSLSREPPLQPLQESFYTNI